MNIKRTKEEIKNAIEAYLKKDEYGAYEIPVIRQRPMLLLGPPGVGKTQIMEQISRECKIGLAAYTITHHTRQSAIGLPFDFPIRQKAILYTAPAGPKSALWPRAVHPHPDNPPGKTQTPYHTRAFSEEISHIRL